MGFGILKCDKCIDGKDVCRPEARNRRDVAGRFARSWEKVGGGEEGDMSECKSEILNQR